MGKLALLAALAVCSVATPAAATIVTTNYSVAGTGTGTFSLNFDTVSSTYSLNSLSLSITGVSTLFNLTNSGIQSNGSSVILGGTVGGIGTVDSSLGVDDFLTSISPTATTQTPPFFFYYKAGNTGVSSGSITVNMVSGVPEPSTWMMMLAGFGAIGMALRFRRRKIIAA